MQHDTSQAVLQAITVLYRGNPSDQQAAGRWLNDFSDKPECAEVALSILSAAQPAEVQFFAANMLLTGVKRNWSRLQHPTQQSIQQKLREEVQAYSNNASSMSWTAVQRMILAYAQICTASGPEAAEQAISNLLQQANQTNAMVSLSMLSGIAEAAGNLHRVQRARFMEVVPSFAQQIFALVNSVLQAAAGNSKLEAVALSCLAAWVKMAVDETSDALVSPGHFFSSQAAPLSIPCQFKTRNRIASQSKGALFEKSFQCLGSSEEEVSTAAAEVLASLFGSWTAYGSLVEEEAAIQKAASMLVQIGASRQPSDDTVMHNLAQVASALANRDTQALAGRIPEAVPLASLMLDALQYGHEGAAESALDYFEVLNAIPVAQRHEQLRSPVYMSMLPHLIRLAQYPEGFTTWEECVEAESDSFHDFRDNVLHDALDTCQTILREHYLEHFGQALQLAKSWQDMEANLFALRSYRRQSQVPGYDPEQSTEEDKYLSAMFNFLVSPERNLSQQHPYLLEGLLQLLCTFSAWVATSPQEVLEAAVSCIFAGLKLPQCWQSAAAAFKLVCSNFPQERADKLFDLMLSAAGPLLHGQSAVSWESKEEIVKGLASLIGTAQMDAARAGKAAGQIALPIAQQALNLAPQTGAGDQAKQEELAGLLGLVATAINRLEFLACPGCSNPQEQPDLVLIHAVFPHLESMAQHQVFRASPDVTQALCKVLKQCLQTLGSHGGDLLNRVIALLAVVFNGSAQACLDVLTTAVDQAQDLPGCQDSLAAVLVQLAEAIQPQLQSEELNPELAATWFLLLAHCLLEDPAQKRTVLTQQVASFTPSHFSLAVSCMRRQEEELCRSLLAFLRNALGLEAAAASELSCRCMNAEGRRLTQEVLRATAVTFPAKLIRMLAILLHSLLRNETFGSSTRNWVQECMSQDPILSQHLDEEVRQQLTQLILNMPPTLPGSFAALLKDMSCIARHESGADVLLSYEL